MQATNNFEKLIIHGSAIYFGCCIIPGINIQRVGTLGILD